MNQPADKHGKDEIDMDASYRRAWYDKARVWLGEYDKEVRRPLMIDVAVDELATLYRAYIQTYETSYFAARSSSGPSRQLAESTNMLTVAEIDHWRESLIKTQQEGTCLPPGSNVLCYMAKAALEDSVRSATGERAALDRIAIGVGAMGSPEQIADAVEEALSHASITIRPATNDSKDAARWRGLKALAGYYQNSSQTAVKLDQDDATRSCFIKVGEKYYGTDGSSFDAAIDAALAYVPREDDPK